MNSPVFSTGGNPVPSATATNYAPMYGSATLMWSATESSVQQVCPISCTLTAMYIYLAAAPGAGNSYAFTVRKGGVNTVVTVTISGTNTTGSITGQSVSIAAGDLISISSVPSGTPPTLATSITLNVSAGSKQGLVSCSSSATISTTLFGTPCGTSDWVGTQANRQGLIPTGGTLNNIYVNLSAAPGVGNSWAITLSVNGVLSALTVTISGTNTTGSGLGLPVTVSAGDKYSIKAVVTGLPSATLMRVGMEWNPTTDGESIHSFGKDGGPSATLNNFNCFIGNPGWNATESARIHCGYSGVTMKNLYVLFGAAPGAGKSRQIALRQNSVTANPSVTISGTNTTGSDTTGTTALANFDAIDYITIPSGTPASPSPMSLGIVAFIAVAGGSAFLSRLSTLGCG